MTKMRNTFAILGSAVVLSVLASTAPARASFIYYSDRAVFNAANPATTLEDFEAATTDTTVSGPQDQTTSNAAFQPGDIIPNLRITAVGTDPDEFFVNQGIYGPTKVMTTNYAGDFARLDFYQSAINAFGVDLSSTNSGGDYTISIFGNSGLLDTRVVTPSAFFGFSSTVGVTRVELNAPTFETFDNIAIGISSVPEPASVLMLGVGLVGLVGYTRYRRAAGASNLA